MELIVKIVYLEIVYIKYILFCIKKRIVLHYNLTIIK